MSRVRTPAQKRRENVLHVERKRAQRARDSAEVKFEGPPFDWDRAIDGLRVMLDGIDGRS